MFAVRDWEGEAPAEPLRRYLGSGGGRDTAWRYCAELRVRCFHHRDRDAVGVCAACWKGLCPDCAVDMRRGLACRERCEPEVRRLRDLRDFSFAQPHVQQEIIGRGRGAVLRSGLFTIVMGAIFIGWWAIYRQFTFMLALGAGFLLYGGVTLMAGRKPRPRLDQFRLCPGCGYNLTGNTTGRCPECGRLA